MNDTPASTSAPPPHRIRPEEVMILLSRSNFSPSAPFPFSESGFLPRLSCPVNATRVASTRYYAHAPDRRFLHFFDELPLLAISLVNNATANLTSHLSRRYLSAARAIRGPAPWSPYPHLRVRRSRRSGRSLGATWPRRIL